MNNEAEVSIKFKNGITGEKKLKEYAETLKSINSILSGLNGKSTKDLETSANNTQDISKDVSNISKKANLAFNYSLISKFASGIKRLGSAFSSLSKQSFDYLENFNLFQVAFNGNYNSAERFVNKMTEMYGLDESWLTRTVGNFKQLTNAMNLTAETGEKVSTLLTQMSLDISSLYNIDIERASETLRSAMAGQTKPIRGATGGDITQATLQQTLDTLGIDNTVAKLSYAEKRLLIIISLTQQLNASIGDMGRTIESPSNQLRIMNEQWERLSRAVGNVFLPILSKILPYLNAILMVLVEIISAIASLLGYKQDDFDYFSGASSSVWDLDEGLQSAGASAKKLKQGLRSFDKLNVITTPSAGGGGAGGGIGNGINPKLMEAFNQAFDNYQKKLDNVQMKATKIRDSIMEWLGFTKEIDPITGKVSFRYQGIKTTLKNVWEWFKKLSPEGKALATAISGIVGSKIIKLFSKLISLLGKTGLYKTLAALLVPARQLFDYFKVYKSLSGSFIGGITGATTSWSKQLTVLDRLKVTLIGSAGIYAGLKLVDSGLKAISKDGEMTTTSFLKLSGGIATTAASGALLGSQFGVWGTLIGGVAAGAYALYKTFLDYPTAITRMNDKINESVKATNEYNDSLKEQYETIQENATQQLTLQSTYESLVTELESIVDENGKVKEGYEDRAAFIVTTLNKALGLEIDLTDGIVENYHEEIQSIKNIIREKKKQIILEASEESYKVALKEKAKTYKNLQTAQDSYNQALKNQREAQKNVNEEVEKWKKTGGLNSFDLKKAAKDLEEAEQATRNAGSALYSATQAYNTNVEAIMNYEGLLSADVQENAELADHYMKQIENTWSDGTKSIKLSRDEQESDALEYYTSILNITKANEQEINDTVLTSAEERLRSLNTNLVDMTKSVDGDLGDNLIKAWGTLANTSEDKFMEEFSKLPPDLQKDVVDKMYEKGYSISEELQNGINEQNPTIKIKGDVSNLKSSIEGFFSRNATTFKNIGISVSTKLKYAQGGLPPVGQLFVANEKGPELVGQIGGQSFVANQNQMLDLLDRKIGNAQNSKTPQVINIYLDEYHKIGSYTLDQLQSMARTNGSSITIGG